MEKNIINSLNRLARLGQENSRMTEKAREAANVLEEKIIKIMPENTSLPMGYIIISNDNGDFLMKEGTAEDHTGSACIGECDYVFGKSQVFKGSRQAILDFSEDLANGLLDKFADFMEERRERMEAAEKTIREASEKM